MLGHPRYTELINAIRHRDKRAVSALLRMGVNPNDCAPMCEPALFVAVRTGDPDIVNLLLTHDADPYIIYQRMNCRKLALTLNFYEIVEMLPEVKSQDWLLIRLKKMNVNVPEQGVCLAIAYLSMLLPEELLANALHELRKVPLPQLETTLKKVETLYNQIIQQVKHEIPADEQAVIRALEQQIDPKLIEQLNNKSLRELLNKLLTNTLINGLDRKTYYLLHAIWIFQAIELLSVPDVHESIFQKEAWYKLSNWSSFKQEKYIHQSLNLLLPLSLLYAGGLRCIAHYSGIYHEFELQEIFEKLQTLVDHHPLNHFLSLIIKGNKHVLHYKFMSHQPPQLIDINRYPVFLPKTQGSHSFSEHFFSNNNITTFSTLIYATGEDATQARHIVSSWQQTSTWCDLHRLSNNRISLRTSNHERWYDNADSGGEIEVYRVLEKNNKDIQFVKNLVAFAMSYVLASLLLTNSRSPTAIGISLTLSILFYFAVNRGFSSYSETVSHYIARDIQQFNQAQRETAQQTKLIKISSNPDTFFQLPVPKAETTSEYRFQNN